MVSWEFFGNFSWEFWEFLGIRSFDIMHFDHNWQNIDFEEDTNFLYALRCATFNKGLIVCQSVVSFAVCQRS